MKKRSNTLSFQILALAALAGAVVATNASGQQPIAGPPGGLAVTVRGGDINVTGEVTVTQEIYSVLAEPTCDAANRCAVEFPAVPAGKILRVSSVYGTLYTSVDGFVMLRTDSRGLSIGDSLIAFPVSHFPAAFQGDLISFNQATDLTIAEGHQPVLLIGSTADIGTNLHNRLGISGTLIDAP